MLFSVVIPVYNAKEHIGVALTSLETQSCRDFETVIVDDGSTDGTAEFLDSYAECHGSVTVIHQQNAGPLIARCSGVAAASGDYVLFLDADDEFTPSALEVIRKQIEKTNADIVMFSFVQSTGTGLIGGPFDMECGLYKCADYLKAKVAICAGQNSNLWSKSIRRTLFDHNDCPPCKGMKHGEDWYQLFPLVDAATSLAVIDDQLYVYNQGDQSGTASYSRNQLEDIRVACRQLWFYAEKWGGDCIQAAACGELLNYIYLVKISERSSISQTEKNANVAEISDAMHQEGVFQRCSGAKLRLDNRIIVNALESQCSLLVRLVAQAVEKMKGGRYQL
ncbi:MAG: glycosyltransferase family 2 protein [Collinsella sp.]|nr:glycosyltransferase family 2 protein [Collinsella sp.]